MKLILVVGAVMVAALSFAQGGGGQGRGGGFGGGQFGGRGGGSDTGYLSSPDVQKELKLTTEQIASITKIQEEARNERQAAMQNAAGGDRTEMMKMMQDMQKKTDAKIAGVLNADQNKRLKQIGIQQAGGRALFREDVQKDLNLTAVQKKSLADLQTKNQENMQQMMQSMRDQSMTREEMQAAMEKNNKSMNDEALKVLTAEQKTAFEAMKGPKFEGKIQMGGGRGGNGGGGQGGGRGGATGGGTGAGRGNGGGGGSTGGGTGGGL